MRRPRPPLPDGAASDATAPPRSPRLRLRSAAGCAAVVAACAGPAAAGAPASAASSAAPAPPAALGDTSAPAPARPRLVALDPRTLLQLALLHNSDVLFSRLQSRVAAEGVAAEDALYEPVAYASLRRDGRSRQRTVEERLTAALGGISRLEEQGKSAEGGVRQRLPSGGEAVLALRSTVRRSNVIASAPFAQGDGEAAGAFVLTLRQPLLRGYGRDVTETDRRVAEAEAEIGRWQFRQQALRVAADALSAYWQLQRAAESQGQRVQARALARELVEDTRARVGGGRMPPAAADEAQANLAAREAELARGALTLAEAEGRLRVLLDLPPDDGGWGLQPPAAEAAEPPVPAAQALPGALAAWPALRIAQVRREQAAQRLQFAVNRQLPGLDLQLSYSTNSLRPSGQSALYEATQGRNPDWSVGLQLEVPLGGDRRASAQARAQALRLEQAELEVRAVRQALASDLYNRAAQLQSATAEWRQWRDEVAARDALLQAESLQYDTGAAALNRLLRRRTDQLEAQLRLGEARTRVELARLALQLADGTLLETHDVRLED